MSPKVYEQIIRRHRRNARRLRNVGGCPTPAMGARGATFDVSDRIQATAAGGVRLAHDLTNAIGLREEIDRRVNLLKVHRPYTESDHVTSMAYNLLAGGASIEDLELRRSDDAYLDMLGTQRIPDPTTAGDFCRRFGVDDIDALQTAINESRMRVWQRQPSSFFDEARVDVDGTIAETSGSCKEGMDLSYKKTWGYQALQVSLANTEEILFQDLGPASQGSQVGAAARLDQAADLLRRAGFRKVQFRGDTAYSQSAHLDGWDDQMIEFVFGFQAHETARDKADSLDAAAWRLFRRDSKDPSPSKTRTRPRNVKADIVCERELYNLHLVCEHVAEFDYQPRACKAPYRMIVLRKLITHERGQRLLHDEVRYLFYITNSTLPAEEVVRISNSRCDQERTIGELKSGVNALSMPLSDLNSNWAYMVIATLAWNLSRWIGLVLPEGGRWKNRRAEEKQRVTKMRFRTFVQAFMCAPAQVVNTGRQLIVRFLDWNPWRHVLFRAKDAVQCLA